MKLTMRLATLAVLGTLPLAGICADNWGAESTGSPRGQDTPGSMGSTGSSHVTGSAGSGSPTASLDRFNSLDSNRDGVIYRSEAANDRDISARFDQLDTNRDGQVSLSEWQAGMSATGAAGVSGSSRGQPSGTVSPSPSDTQSPSGTGSPTR
ncbi:MAG: hypothetical protein H6R10_1976 [Rhodocyclaceae bacterium]|nr:hypothetical protein [Rhodocyclaceae bacterium]